MIVGEPNVGKSSLLNALLRGDRAIVAPTPGTTRDLIEAQCNVRGLPLRLIDTAGQRDSTDPIEIEGNRRARALMPNAQLLLHVVEAHQPYVATAHDLPENIPSLLIANKSDLGRHASVPAEAIFLSAITGEGLGDLEARIEAALLADASPTKRKPSSPSTPAKTPPSNAPRNRSTARSRQFVAHSGLGLVSVELRDALARSRRSDRRDRQ